MAASPASPGHNLAKRRLLHQPGANRHDRVTGMGSSTVKHYQDVKERLQQFVQSVENYNDDLEQDSDRNYQVDHAVHNQKQLPRFSSVDRSASHGRKLEHRHHSHQHQPPITKAKHSKKTF